ncbi:hypothetical protein TNCV_4720751 [Trichonephila clavipes]|uniref:Uncharacterized protein n=1 Tax=Trichonephila clavipes TaxID=2585209 RepID=A0A8X6W6K9_TRICX|nr:hypothetical protein TNCV_4720751 [Trichonephila clavipes]
MYASSSSVNPTPQTHADTQKDIPLRGDITLAPKEIYFIRSRRLCGGSKSTKHGQLLEVLSNFEEGYSCKVMRGSRYSDNVERRGWSNRIIEEIGSLIEDIGLS